MKIFALLTLVVCSFFPGYTVTSDLPCTSQSFSSGCVCVCTSTYCDTVETPVKLEQGSFYQYKTSKTSPGFTRSQGSFKNCRSGDENGIEIKINATVKYQEIVGFGGSITDSSWLAINSLPKGARTKLVKSYFGSTGIEYNILRVPIGGTDFSKRVYTLDDTPNDKNLTHFRLAKEDLKKRIPFIKEAMLKSNRDIKLMGSSWMAPAWMKINNVKTAQFIKKEHQRTWAQYHVRFLEEYQKQGLTVWALTGGNEPFLQFWCNGEILQDFTLTIAPDQRSWVKKHLKPVLVSSNFSDVKLFILDDQRSFAPYWMGRFALDPEALAAIDGIALHTYHDSTAPVTYLDDIHSAFPDKTIVYNEISINEGIPVDLGSWDRAETYLRSLFENLNHWAVTFMDWNLALDTEGGPSLSHTVDCPIIVDKDSKQFYKQPMFYAMGHFSKFLQPGAVRVQVTCNEEVFLPRQEEQDNRNKEAFRSFYSDLKQSSRKDNSQDTVWNIAFTNPDGSCTVILYNSDDNDQAVTIEDSTVGTVSLQLEKKSLNTFIYWP